VKSAAVAASSTTSPQYITVTPSQVAATTARSWVTSRMPRPSRSRRDSSSSSTRLQRDVRGRWWARREQQRRLGGERDGVIAAALAAGELVG
jgi:hypothetical protein